MAKVTLGLEEEAFLLDANNRPLSFNKERLLNALQKEGVSASVEYHTNMIGVKTGIAPSIDALVNETRFNRETLVDLVASLYPKSKLLFSGTEPYNDWLQTKHNSGRYGDLWDEYGDVLQRMYTSGVHLHVGLPRNRIAKVFNGLSNFIPFIIAASANSPYFPPGETTVACARMLRVLEMPNSGLPPSISSISMHEKQIEALSPLSQCVHDIRFHSEYKTIEVRCIDPQNNVNAAIGMTVLMYVLLSHCNRAFLPKLVSENPFLMNEARWLACRYGRDMILNTPIMNISTFPEFCSHALALTDVYAPSYKQILQWFLLEYPGGAIENKEQA